MAGLLAHPEHRFGPDADQQGDHRQHHHHCPHRGRAGRVHRRIGNYRCPEAPLIDLEHIDEGEDAADHHQGDDGPVVLFRRYPEESGLAQISSRRRHPGHAERADGKGEPDQPAAQILREEEQGLVDRIDYGEEHRRGETCRSADCQRDQDEARPARSRNRRALLPPTGGRSPATIRR